MNSIQQSETLENDHMPYPGLDWTEDSVRALNNFQIIGPNLLVLNEIAYTVYYEGPFYAGLKEALQLEGYFLIVTGAKVDTKTLLVDHKSSIVLKPSIIMTVALTTGMED